MIDVERDEARKSFEAWATMTVEMIDDGSLPGGHARQAALRAILTEPGARDLAWGIFLAGFMSVEVDEG